MNGIQKYLLIIISKYKSESKVKIIYIKPQFMELKKENQIFQKTILNIQDQY